MVFGEPEANRSRQGHPGKSWQMPIGARMQACDNSDGGHISIGGDGSKTLAYVCITLEMGNLGRDSCFSAPMFSHREIRFQFKLQEVPLWCSGEFFFFFFFLTALDQTGGASGAVKLKPSFGWRIICPFRSPPQGRPSSSNCLSWGQRFITFKTPPGKSQDWCCPATKTLQIYHRSWEERGRQEETQHSSGFTGLPKQRHRLRLPCASLASPSAEHEPSSLNPASFHIKRWNRRAGKRCYSLSHQRRGDNVIGQLWKGWEAGSGVRKPSKMGK